MSVKGTPLDLTGRRVLITGASRGLGSDLARGFAQAGADLALVARDAASLEALVAEHGGRAYPTDLTDPAATRELIARVEADGSVDVLINNAADERVGPFTALDADGLEFVVRLNALAPAELCRQIVPRMVDRGRGRIVNVTSFAGITCVPHLAAYSATKAFLTHLTVSLELELRDTPVVFTKVEMGGIDGTGQGDRFGPTPYPPRSSNACTACGSAGA